MTKNVYKENIEQLNIVDLQYSQLFNNHNFLDYDEVSKKINELLHEKLKFSLKYLLQYFDYGRYNKLYKIEKNKLSNYKSDVDEHNKLILKDEISNFKNVCGLIEGKELDDQQIDAIVRKNNNQLVIAGAGSGKTTTIVGKIKYLLKTEKYKPEEI